MGRSELTAPGMYSVPLPSPPRTNRRLSVEFFGTYFFPFTAFDGDIINDTAEFVKGFLKISLKKI